MSLEPPPFQESTRCDVCKCSFSTFRRRHHCRCCGRTLCAEHSSDQMALPQFGLHSPVRVCSNCYNNASRSGNSNGGASVNGVNSMTDSVARLDISTPSNSDTTQGGATNCTCGMPLCICEVASNDDVAPLQPKPVPTFTAPKKVDTAPRNRGSSSSKSSSGQSSNASSERPLAEYEVNGEGLREAIKNGDLFSVRKLLGEGVDANYCDKQGLSLLHLAIVPVREGSSISYQCPLLTATNYTSWAIKMESIMDAHGIWDAIEPCDEAAMDAKIGKKARAFIFQALPEDILLQVAGHKTAKEVWAALKTRYLGADRVQQARISTLNREFELLSMKETDNIDDFAGKIGEIVSKFRILGSTLDEKAKVKKLLNSAPTRFLPIVATIEQYSDLNKMPFEELVGRLKAYEERLKPA